MYQKYVCEHTHAKRIARSHETESCYGYSQLDENPELEWRFNIQKFQ